MTKILFRYSKDRSCNKQVTLVDLGLVLGIFKGFKKNSCEICKLKSRITQKKFYHTEKIKNFFYRALINFS